MCKFRVFIVADFVSLLFMGYFIINLSTLRSITKNDIDYASNTQITYLSCELLCETYPYQLDQSLCCISSTQLDCKDKTQCLGEYLYIKNNEWLTIRIQLIFAAIVESVLGVLLIVSICFICMQHRQRNEDGIRQRAMAARLMLYALRFQRREQFEEEQEQYNRSLLTQPFIAEDKDQICAICLEAFAEQKVVSLNCRHLFHLQCVEAWIQRETKCPVCRAQQ